MESVEIESDIVNGMMVIALLIPFDTGVQWHQCEPSY
jgi:hypothetical protein